VLVVGDDVGAVGADVTEMEPGVGCGACVGLSVMVGAIVGWAVIGLFVGAFVGYGVGDVVVDEVGVVPHMSTPKPLSQIHTDESV
jgi:hypothetical protein